MFHTNPTVVIQSGVKCLAEGYLHVEMIKSFFFSLRILLNIWIGDGYIVTARNNFYFGGSMRWFWVPFRYPANRKEYLVFVLRVQGCHPEDSMDRYELRRWCVWVSPWKTDIAVSDRSRSCRSSRGRFCTRVLMDLNQSQHRMIDYRNTIF